MVQFLGPDVVGALHRAVEMRFDNYLAYSLKLEDTMAKIIRAWKQLYFDGYLLLMSLAELKVYFNMLLSFCIEKLHI